MEIPNLKRWQWACIGMVFGAVLALPNVMTNPGDRYAQRRTVTAQRFLFDLKERGSATDLPMVRNITIYPPVAVHIGGKDEQRVFVTAERLDEFSANPPVYQLISVYVPQPLPAISGPDDSPQMRAMENKLASPTLRDYLDGLKKSGIQIDYRYLWWASPSFVLLCWIGGGLVVVGGIWPTLVRWSRRGQADTEADVAIGLFGKAVTLNASANPIAAGESMPQSDDLPADAALSSAPVPETQPVSAAPAVALSGGPLEQVAESHKDDNEYDGEYYPVAHPHGHPTTPPSSPAPPTRPRQAFSIVELLVVIGIIALLISLMLPALSKARRQSQTIACQSNLHQIGIMLQIYENDNRGWFFPCKDEGGVVTGLGANVPPNERWPMIVFKVAGAPNPPPFDPGSYQMEPWDPITYPAAPFTPPVMRCPADLDPADAHSYLLNHHLIDKRLKASSHDFGGLTAPEVILAGEKVSTRRDYMMQEGDYDQAVELYRHGLDVGSNYLFLDCHAATLLPGDARGGIDPWDVKGQNVTVSE